MYFPSRQIEREMKVTFLLENVLVINVYEHDQNT